MSRALIQGAAVNTWAALLLCVLPSAVLGQQPLCFVSDGVANTAATGYERSFSFSCPAGATLIFPDPSAPTERRCQRATGSTPLCTPGSGVFVVTTVACICSAATRRLANYQTSTDGGTTWVTDASRACYTCLNVDGTGATVAGDPKVTGFDGTSWYFHGQHGVPYALLSGPQVQVNAIIGAIAPGQFNNDWLLEVMIRMRNHTVRVAVEELLSSDVDVVVDEGASHTSKRRMNTRNATLPVFLEVDGGRQQDWLLSGQLVTLDQHNSQTNTTVYFPPVQAENPNDAHDRPVAVVSGNGWEITVYYETEDSIHLDVAFRMLEDMDSNDVHGIIGQTLAWQLDDSSVEQHALHNHTMLGESDHYLLKDGLFGVEYQFGTFEKQAVAGRNLKGGKLSAAGASARFGTA